MWKGVEQVSSSWLLVDRHFRSISFKGLTQKTSRREGIVADFEDRIEFEWKPAGHPEGNAMGALVENAAVFHVA